MIFELTSSHLTNSERMEMEKNKQILNKLVNMDNFPKGYASWEMFKKSSQEKLQARVMASTHKDMLKHYGFNPKKQMNLPLH